MDRPRTLHWPDAGTPTTACTCVVLLHRSSRLLSNGARVYGALDPGSACRIEAQRPVRSPCSWGFLLVMYIHAQPRDENRI